MTLKFITYPHHYPPQPPTSEGGGRGKEGGGRGVGGEDII